MAQLTFSCEQLTPDVASRLLKEHDEAVLNGVIVNRRRKLSAVRRIAADILADQWFPQTGETIKFERNGNGSALATQHGHHLVDGQTRLAAVEQAKRAIDIWVAIGVERQAFIYIDSGEKRTLRNVLQIQGETESTILAPALNWLNSWDWETNTVKTGKGSVTHAAGKRMLEADPAIRRSAQLARPVTLLGRGLSAFLHRIMSKKDQTLADLFIDAIVTGTNLRAGDPFYVLRERLIANKTARRKMGQTELIAIAVKAWNAQRENRPVKSLKYRQKEAFPVLV